MSGPGKGADRGAWQDAQGLLEGEAAEDAVISGLISLSERSKAARRGVASAIDGSERRGRVRQLLAERGGEADEGSTERLLRRARGADVDAQIRKNPIHRNEAFVCVGCGKDVPAAPSGVRNHCPWCLCSLHVDGEVPGDRASECHGLMRPVSIDTTGGLWVTQTCSRCGHTRRNRLHPDWDPGPDRTTIP